MSLNCLNTETSQKWYRCHGWLPPPLLSAWGHCVILLFEYWNESKVISLSRVVASAASVRVGEGVAHYWVGHKQFQPSGSDASTTYCLSWRCKLSCCCRHRRSAFQHVNSSKPLILRRARQNRSRNFLLNETSGKSGKQVTWCFTPSQPLRSTITRVIWQK